MEKDDRKHHVKVARRVNRALIALREISRDTRNSFCKI